MEGIYIRNEASVGRGRPVPPGEGEEEPAAPQPPHPPPAHRAEVRGDTVLHREWAQVPHVF